MRKCTTDWMDDDKYLVMGILEPILVLAVIAIVPSLVRLFW
jgi:hypothetical protein